MNSKADESIAEPEQKMSSPPSIYHRYWRAYGGTKAILTSKYFWLSFIVSLLLFRIWSQPDWWDIVLSVIPNLLGFSLGGFALWISIGDDKFRSIIASKEPDESISIYEGVNANFVHFILLQVLAIILALIASAANFSLSHDNWLIVHYYREFRIVVTISSLIGFWFFIYALFSALAATMGLFTITYMYESYIQNKKHLGKEP